MGAKKRWLHERGYGDATPKDHDGDARRALAAVQLGKLSDDADDAEAAQERRDEREALEAIFGDDLRPADAARPDDVCVVVAGHEPPAGAPPLVLDVLVASVAPAYPARGAGRLRVGRRPERGRAALRRGGAGGAVQSGARARRLRLGGRGGRRGRGGQGQGRGGAKGCCGGARAATTGGAAGVDEFDRRGAGRVVAGRREGAPGRVRRREGGPRPRSRSRPRPGAPAAPRRWTPAARRLCPRPSDGRRRVGRWGVKMEL